MKLKMTKTAWQKCCHLWLFDSIYLSIYYSIYISIHISIYISICISFDIASFLFINPSIYLSWKIKEAHEIPDEILYHSIFLSIYLSFYLLSIYLSWKIKVSISNWIWPNRHGKNVVTCEYSRAGVSPVTCAYKRSV